VAYRTLAVARGAGPLQWVWRAACARASPRPNRRTVDTGTAPGDRLRGNKRRLARLAAGPPPGANGAVFCLTDTWSGSYQRDVPKCLFWRHALTPLAGLYSELGAVSIGIAHVRRLFGAFEPKRYLPLSKIADGVRGAEVSEIVDAREKTVKTRMFCARKRLSELRAKTSTRRARGTHVVHWTGN
jgi:hypothetical protein